MAVPKLIVENLGKTFHSDRGDIVALDGVDLEVGENEFLSLVGTSGCGKSTLLMIVAGLESASSGRVAIDGAEVDLPGLDRGVVFQSYTLLPWLTALGNVEFALRAAGREAAQARQIALEHLALVGLQEFADAYPFQLSGGMKQRVASARALSYQSTELSVAGTVVEAKDPTEVDETCTLQVSLTSASTEDFKFAGAWCGRNIVVPES